MPLPNLISFSGYATAGKDSAADTLVEHHAYHKTYMSKPLEKALLTLDPIIQVSPTKRYTEIHAEMGYDESKKLIEVRRLLQFLGTEIGRNMFGEDAWLDLVFEEIFALDGRVALTGVRYKNEMDRVRAEGGVTVWVHRPGIVAVNNHSSDNTLKPEHCDVQIANNGTLEDLYLNLVLALHQNSNPWNFNQHAYLVQDVKSTDELFSEASAALWRAANPTIGQVISSEITEKGLEVEYTLDCDFGNPPEHFWSSDGYTYTCKTHGSSVTVKTEGTPEKCSKGGGADGSADSA